MDAALAERLVAEFNKSRQPGMADATVGKWTAGEAAFFAQLTGRTEGDDGDGGGTEGTDND